MFFLPVLDTYAVIFIAKMSMTKFTWLIDFIRMLSSFPALEVNTSFMIDLLSFYSLWADHN